MPEDSLLVSGRLVLCPAPADSFAPIFSDEWLGTELWPAARTLVAYLERERRMAARAHRVVELGAGTGACGLAAALVGATDVLLTDKPSLLPAMQANAAANGLAHVRCAALEWSVHGLRSDELLEGSDLVLMSDCLNPVYGEQHAVALAATLHALLSRAEAQRCFDDDDDIDDDDASQLPLGVLSQTRRGHGEAEAEFFAECKRRGMSATLVETAHVPTADSGTLVGEEVEDDERSDAAARACEQHEPSHEVGLYLLRLG